MRVNNFLTIVFPKGNLFDAMELKGESFFFLTYLNFCVHNGLIANYNHVNTYSFVNRSSCPLLFYLNDQGEKT